VWNIEVHLPEREDDFKTMKSFILCFAGRKVDWIESATIERAAARNIRAAACLCHTLWADD
jgi:hypothetical protein